MGLGAQGLRLPTATLKAHAPWLRGPGSASFTLTLAVAQGGQPDPSPTSWGEVTGKSSRLSFPKHCPCFSSSAPQNCLSVGRNRTVPIFQTRKAGSAGRWPGTSRQRAVWPQAPAFNCLRGKLPSPWPVSPEAKPEPRSVGPLTSGSCSSLKCLKKWDKEVLNAQRQAALDPQGRAHTWGGGPEVQAGQVVLEGVVAPGD